LATVALQKWKEDVSLFVCLFVDRPEPPMMMILEREDAWGRIDEQQ